MLALDVWRQSMSLMPWHFWQFAGDPIPIIGQCSGVTGLTYEYAWQAADSAGRDDVRRALALAEQRIAAYLDHPLAPTNRTAILDVPWPQWTIPQRFTLPDAFVQGLGHETLTLLGEEGIGYDDLDGDGLAETGSIIFATTETDPDRLALMVPAADRYDGTDAGDRWLLAPVTITIASGIAVARMPRWLLGKPAYYQRFDGAAIDPKDNAAVLSTVEVYTRSIDTAGAITCASCACGARTTSTSYDASTARVINSAAGVVDLCPTCMACGSCDQITINYVAGPARSRGTMAEPYAGAVARLATAELAQAICACKDANREIYRWQYDLAQTGANQEQYGAVSAEDLNNPFGTRRGAVTAWRMLRHTQTPRGLYVG